MTSAEHAQAVADALPPLTDGQRAKLAALLAGAVAAVAERTQAVSA